MNDKKLTTAQTFITQFNMMNAISSAHETGRGIPAISQPSQVETAYDEVIKSCTAAIKHAERLKGGCL